ncbi:hypothetical protein [Fictibacillus phosphorivorans]|nr:hypothetical protein [Fictibacillus phosphorivorans]
MVVLLKTLRQQERLFLLVWREGLQFEIGETVGLDIEDDKIVIDKKGAKRFTQLRGLRGRITISLVVREKLEDQTYHVLVKHETEQPILMPA